MKFVLHHWNSGERILLIFLCASAVVIGAFWSVRVVYLRAAEQLTARVGLPRFRGQVNAFGHLMTFASTVVGVGAVGHARSAWSKGLVGARRASTGPAASTPGAAA